MMLFLPVWWKWLHRKRRKELLEIMSEQNRQEEAARNDRQRLEQQAVESRQLSERALAEERQRQEIRRMQDEQRRQDSQRQEQEPAREERLKEETRRKEENSQRKDDKNPQSQELRDLANTEDKYMRLIKSGYYDEKRAEKAAEKTEGGNGMEQMKEAPTKGGFSERREALKTKVQDALRKQEHSKTHDIGHSR